MTIAEAIYQQVQQLPEHLAKEVLEFIDYLKKRHGLPDEPVEEIQNAYPACAHKKREECDDEVWSDLLFGQSRFDAASVTKPKRPSG